MNIIIDSNVLFSALIKNSTTRKLILDYVGFFLFPSFIFEELERHKKELLVKSGMKESDFDRLLQLLLLKVVIVPSEVLLSHREEALRLVESIDVNDAVFIACALAFPDSLIWSDDAGLKRVEKIRVLNTKEIMEFL